jgi:hypothetical protein
MNAPARLAALPTTPGRLLELERTATSAEERIAHARRRSSNG